MTNSRLGPLSCASLNLADVYYRQGRSPRYVIEPLQSLEYADTPAHLLDEQKPWGLDGYEWLPEWRKKENERP